MRWEMEKNTIARSALIQEVDSDTDTIYGRIPYKGFFGTFPNPGSRACLHFYSQPTDRDNIQQPG